MVPLLFPSNWRSSKRPSRRATLAAAGRGIGDAGATIVERDEVALLDAVGPNPDGRMKTGIPLLFVSEASVRVGHGPRSERSGHAALSPPYKGSSMTSPAPVMKAQRTASPLCRFC